MNKKLLVLLGLLMAVCITGVFAQSASSSVEETSVEAVSSTDLTGAVKYIAAALAVGIACIGGALAVGKIGAAAMGAMSENAELSGKALVFVGLAEGICLWGFIVAVLIIFM